MDLIIKVCESKHKSNTLETADVDDLIKFKWMVPKDKQVAVNTIVIAAKAKDNKEVGFAAAAGKAKAKEKGKKACTALDEAHKFFA